MRALLLGTALLGAAAHAQDAAPRLGAVEAAGFVVPGRPAVPEAVTVTTRYAAYAVTGATDAAIWASIDAASPFRNADGSKRSDAFTTWRLVWRPTFTPRPTECVVTAVRIALDLETTMWDWTPPPGTPPETVREWDHRTAVLLRHEVDHQTISVLAALDLADRLGGLSAPTCPQLYADVDAAGQALLVRLREVHAAFDEATARGTRPPPGAR